MKKRKGREKKERERRRKDFLSLAKEGRRIKASQRERERESE